MAALSVFKKKQSEGTVGQDWKDSGSFIRKPARGWFHPDHAVQNGVTYEAKYVGAVEILESMRKIPFEERGKVVREAIAICCDKSGLVPAKKKKISQSSNSGVLGEWHGRSMLAEVTAKISTLSLVVLSIKDGSKILDHKMESISFASMGEGEYKNLIGYVAKDAAFERACFVLDCAGGLADDIIHTIGQAFELKYKEFLKSPVQAMPVVERFTDPVFDQFSWSPPNVNNNLALKHGPGDPDYSRLSHGSLFPRKDSADGYARLNSLQTSFDESDTGFLPGPSYGGLKDGAGILYDNPIASLAAKRLMHRPSSLESPYDNPSSLLGDVDDVAPSPVLRPNRLDLSHVDLAKRESDIYLTPTPVSPVDLPELQAESPTSPYSKLDRTISRDIDKEVWFHGALTRGDAEELIKQDGEFLVRESSSAQGQFVLTGMKAGQHRHLLLVDPEGRVRTRDHSFESVKELVQFYKSGRLPIHSGGSDVFLVQEVLHRNAKLRDHNLSVRV